VESSTKRKRIPDNLRRAIGASFLALIMLTAAYVLDVAALLRDDHWLPKLFALGGAAVFVLIGVIAVRNLGSVAAERIERRMTAGHASALRLAISLFGYVGLAIVVLNTLGVNLGQLLVGGALTGVVIGIAAQQSLGNVFAGIVLLSSQPFSVGDHVVIHSGGLGGPHRGQVVEMGLVYLTLQAEDGQIKLPNSAVLNAAVGPAGAAVSDSKPVVLLKNGRRR
jgi:small-conductance mechanosensitive channel